MDNQQNKIILNKNKKKVNNQVQKQEQFKLMIKCHKC